MVNVNMVSDHPNTVIKTKDLTDLFSKANKHISKIWNKKGGKDK